MATKMLTLTEVAKLLRINYEVLRKNVRAGNPDYPPAIIVGRECLRFREDELNEWMESRKPCNPPK